MYCREIPLNWRKKLILRLAFSSLRLCSRPQTRPVSFGHCKGRADGRQEAASRKQYTVKDVFGFCCICMLYGGATGLGVKGMERYLTQVEDQIGFTFKLPSSSYIHYERSIIRRIQETDASTFDALDMKHLVAEYLTKSGLNIEKVKREFPVKSGWKFEPSKVGVFTLANKYRTDAGVRATFGKSG